MTKADAAEFLNLEYRVAEYFEPRRNLVVPNLSWGLGFGHELDLAVVSASGYLQEIELKTSIADLRADARKRHNHIDNRNRIRALWFAVPKRILEPALPLIPAPAGILCVDDQVVTVIRRPGIIKGAKPLDANEVEHLYRLAAMRIWTLKATLLRRLEAR